MSSSDTWETSDISPSNVSFDIEAMRPPTGMRWGGLQAGDLSQLRAQSQTASAFQEMLEQMKQWEAEAKLSGRVVASQAPVPNSNGHVYAPYVPLQIAPLPAGMFPANATFAVPLSVPGGPNAPIVNLKRRFTGNNAQFTHNNSNPCAEIHLDMPITTPGPILFRPELFQDEHRERDNIIWRVPEGASLFPIYSSYHHGQNMLELRSVTQRSTREYFCHDDNLHEMRPYAGYSLEEYANGNLGQVRDFLSERQSVFERLLRVGIRRASEYMVYEFPKHINDGSGWLVGFASHYENFIADAVDFDEIDDVDEDLDINTDIHYRYRHRADERLGDARGAFTTPGPF
jgi:hypothetical protein